LNTESLGKEWRVAEREYKAGWRERYIDKRKEKLPANWHWCWTCLGNWYRLLFKPQGSLFYLAYREVQSASILANKVLTKLPQPSKMLSSLSQQIQLQICWITRYKFQVTSNSILYSEPKVNRELKTETLWKGGKDLANDRHKRKLYSFWNKVPEKMWENKCCKIRCEYWKGYLWGLKFNRKKYRLRQLWGRWEMRSYGLLRSE